jgi:hypothetical protein
MAWNPFNSPIDYILLRGLKSPGIAEVVDANSPRNWDERRGYGFSGATVIFRGVGLAYPVIKFRLWTEEHWDLWSVFRVLLEKPPFGERAQAMSVWHPHLEAQGITSVVVQDLASPVNEGNGIWSITVKFIEYRRPKVALAKPDGAKAAEVDPIESGIIEPLLSQFTALSGPKPPPLPTRPK